MSNFIETYKQGKLGKNFGLTTGIPALDEATNGTQRGQSIAIAAAPKVGKTTLCDYSYVLSPYLQMEALGKLDEIDWTYWSYEISRVKKEFKFAAFFMAHDFQQYHFKYKDKMFLMSSDYLMHKLKYRESGDQVEMVPVTPEHEEMLKEIYEKRIVPLFGEYADNGEKLKPGKIDFIEEPDNPTGLYKHVKHYAAKNGIFLETPYQSVDDKGNAVLKKRISGWVPNNPDKYSIFICDHVRKLRLERGYTLKQNVDKWLEYSTELRNLCNFIFLHIIHSGRQLANMERLKYAGEFIYPTGDDTKDTGNVSEEVNLLLTMFNPGDEKYNLDKHFGVELKDHPLYRSIHIADARDVECPQHIQTNMIGGINMFTPLNY